MQHQRVFLPMPSPISTGVLQVAMPLHENEKTLAMTSLAEAFERT
jgi:hypothetical protein